MATSPVAIPSTPRGWSGHFTVHSPAVKSRTPYTPVPLRLTTHGPGRSICPARPTVPFGTERIRAMQTPLSRPIALAVAALVLALASSSTPAQEKAPKTDAPDATPFAYAAPAFIKELDTRYPASPPVPPPPRYG